MFVQTDGEHFIWVPTQSPRFSLTIIENIYAFYFVFILMITVVTLLNYNIGQVFGGDVLRFFHGDECLTLPEAGSENIFE